MSKRFFGDKKIETAQEEGELVVVTFSDGETLKVPKKLYEISASKDSLTATELWDRQCAPIVKETLELWLSWDVKLEQLDYIINMIKTSVEHNLSRAGDNLWGKKMSDRRMSDVNNVLLNVKQ